MTKYDTNRFRWTIKYCMAREDSSLKVNTETIQMRIDRLKNMIAECPSGKEAPGNIQHILETAPQIIKNAESTLQTNIPEVLEELNDALEQTEVLVTWATGTIKGQAMAQAIKNGHEAEPDLPVDQRLLNRITKFMLAKVDSSAYLQMVKEFSGNDAVDGNTVYIDPRNNKPRRTGFHYSGHQDKSEQEKNCGGHSQICDEDQEKRQRGGHHRNLASYDEIHE